MLPHLSISFQFLFSASRQLFMLLLVSELKRKKLIKTNIDGIASQRNLIRIMRVYLFASVDNGKKKKIVNGKERIKNQIKPFHSSLEAIKIHMN